MGGGEKHTRPGKRVRCSLRRQSCHGMRIRCTLVDARLSSDPAARIQAGSPVPRFPVPSRRCTLQALGSAFRNTLDVLTHGACSGNAVVCQRLGGPDADRRGTKPGAWTR